MSLRQLVTVSPAAGPGTRAELARLAASAARRHAELGVTGLVLHHEGSVLHGVEGSSPALEALLAELRAEAGAPGLVVLADHPTQQREFGSSGLTLVDSGDLGEHVRSAIEPLVTYAVGIDDALLAIGRAHRVLRWALPGAA